MTSEAGHQGAALTLAVGDTAGPEQSAASSGALATVIRIEPGAAEIIQTDSLNSNNSCGNHRDRDQSLSSTHSEDTTASAASEGEGVANPAFVEDEEAAEDGGCKKKKGHHRRPSCSPNKDIEIVMAGSGAAAAANPPILPGEEAADTADTADKGAYTEYFMPAAAEHKAELGDYKPIKKSKPTAAKIFCWIMSSLLLAGAVVVAVLIGTGIIDTDPAIATVKVSRKLVPELASARPGPGAVQLLEVRGEDAPNVLTNDPGFFSHKTEVGSFAGRMRLTSVAWHPDLADPSSPRHQQLAGSLGTELDSLLGRRYSSLAFHTTLAGLAEGSVVASFRIDVASRTGGSDVITAENIRDTILENLDTELGLLCGRFLVAPASVEVRPAEDEEESSLNELEQELETLEQRIFSKPGLESDIWTALLFGPNTDTSDQDDQAETATIEAETGAEEATARLADTELDANTRAEQPPALAAVDGGKSEEEKQTDEVDSATETIYAFSEVEEETRTEYPEVMENMETNVEPIEFVFFQVSEDRNDDADDEALEVTTEDDMYLELNTVHSNIQNF